jgi:hypothetical protein
MANLIAVSRAPSRIDVLFIGQAGPGAPWRLYNVWWDGGPSWANSRIVGTAGNVVPPDLEPLSPIAACCRDADTVDVFAVGADGALLKSTFTRAAGDWSPLLPIGGRPVIDGNPLSVASVDGAVFQAATDITVVVTGRDTNVWVTHFDPGIPGYTTLERMIPLNPA